MNPLVRLHKNVMLITHNTNLAKLGDRVIYLKDGKIEKIIREEHPINVDELS
jgi:putative ABC transport system ATP-binding protein